MVKITRRRSLNIQGAVQVTFYKREWTFVGFEFEVIFKVLVGVYLLLVPTGKAGLFKLEYVILLRQWSEQQLELVLALWQNLLAIGLLLLGILSHFQIKPASFGHYSNLSWQRELNALLELFGVFGPVVLRPDVQIFFNELKKKAK